ncbi:MAG: hypothetical protein LLG02_09555 [Pelosinus sp.]|nr:hypothetical protein [Pelosinus sp.]
MLKILHKREVEGLSLSPKVISVIWDAVMILDEEYGEDRAESDGGYVLVLESREEISRLAEHGIDFNTNVPEYVDIFEDNKGQKYTSSLVLLGTEFAIVVIVPGEKALCLQWEKYI